MTYLGPDTMELPVEQEERRSFLITPGQPEELRLRLLAKIEPGDRIQVGTAYNWGPVMEVYDTDKEGTVLWNNDGAETEEGAARFDLSVPLEAGSRVRVLPR